MFVCMLYGSYCFLLALMVCVGYGNDLLGSSFGCVGS